ncbi:MAG: MMPL family transporter [Thermomicrobiales bacterium]
MALTRLTDFIASRTGKWVVLAVWLVLAVVAGAFGNRLGEVEENDASAWLPRSAESTEVVELQPAFFGDETIPAVIVYEREGGITAEDQAAVEDDRQALTSIAFGGQIPPVTTSEDGQALLLTIPLVEDEEDDELLFDQIDEIKATVQEGAPEGLNVKVSGPAGSLADFIDVFDEIDGTLILATVSVVTVLLLIIYRSPVLWLLPLLTVGIASQFANAFVYLLARYADITVNGQSAGILTVLVFGAGTDYALLLLARYREDLHNHEDKHEAMQLALRRAGPAILASSATVMVGMLCLLAAELNSNRGLGPVAAAGIFSALLAMTTLLPALLVILGRWLFWPFVPRFGKPSRDELGIWTRVANWVGRTTRPAWIGTVVLLAVLALGLTRMETGLTAAEQFTTKPESIEGQEIIADHFPAGASTPAYVIANAPSAQAVTEAAQGVEGVANVEQPLTADDPASGEPLAMIPVILADDPSSGAAKETIEHLRDAVHAVPDAGAIVGGDTAVALDISEASSRDERVIIPLVLLVVFIILVLLLRAIVAPLVLMATVVLSFLAAVGASVVAFDWIFGYAGVDFGFLLFAFIFLVALGIDYNIFLMTRVREEVEKHGHREGVLGSLAVTGGVITSAGIVLAATFAVLTVFPLVFLVEVGVVIAFGVLLDTFLVRSILVPALALEIGPKTWWPSRLMRERVPARQPAEVGAATNRR